MKLYRVDEERVESLDKQPRFIREHMLSMLESEHIIVPVEATELFILCDRCKGKGGWTEPNSGEWMACEKCTQYLDVPSGVLPLSKEDS